MPSETPKTQLRTALLAVGTPPEKLDELLDRGRRVRLPRGEAFVRQGDDGHRMGFIHAGIIRYHVHVEGEDVTKEFALEGSFIFECVGAVLGVPARGSVSAVEDCELTAWPWPDFEAGLTPGMWRRAIGMILIRREARELALRTLDAGARYRSVVEEFPAEDFARIPQHLLASYLGIAPESLSRVKRQQGALEPSPSKAAASLANRR